jgi:23S rRNA pseudouridine1911/1915/1917 synthase
MPPIQFLIERRESGQTVAEVLRKRYQLSWAKAKKVVERGQIRVAGQLTRAPEQRVKSGNRFWIAAGAFELKPALVNPDRKGGGKSAAPKPEPPKPKPAAKPKPKAPPAPAITLDLVYSDDAIVVVNKPIGLTTSRSKEDIEEFGKGQKFLPKTLAELLPAALGVPNRRVYAVHRLDRDTTGLLVFARNSTAAKHLTEQFRRRTVDRRYLALTRGVPTDGRIESKLVDDRGDGRRGSGEAPGAKRAVTAVRVLERFPSHALVECKLDTGRTHQVRIHLGEAGHPLCGERVYDRPLKGRPLPDDSGAERPMLHAMRLAFIHPETDQIVGWEVDPPADFAAVLSRVK